MAFFLADINIEVILRIYFLILSVADMRFINKELTWKSYLIAKSLLITKGVKLINKKKFTKVILNENSKTFVVHIIVLKALKPTGIIIHYFWAI